MRPVAFFVVAWVGVGCARVIDDGNDAAPTAVAGADQEVDVGAVVTFDGSASEDDVGIEAFAWDFGDSSSGIGAVVDHIYVAAGGFVATLTVTDSKGEEATDTVVVRVVEPAVVAVVAVEPAAGAVGDTFTFDATASTSPAGSTISSVSWRFGDGSVGDGERVSHVYAAAGSFTVRATVTDSSGGSDEASVVVVVAGVDVSGTWDLVVPPFVCPEYAAVFPETTLVITQVGNTVTALGANGRSYTGVAAEGFPLRGDASIDTNAACGAAIVDVDWRPSLTAAGTLSGIATGFFNLPNRCQCTAVWNIVATRR